MIDLTNMPTPDYVSEDGSVVLYNGDCEAILRRIRSDAVDSCVTDPPYGLSFMGRKWDYDVPSQAIWRECLRVLKPGGHLLSFAGTRTQHRMAVNIEDAGFEIRDMIAWVYGSGFPKSLDVSKAIDKAAGAERERYQRPAFGGSFSDDGGTTYGTALADTPATEAAKQWQGWGTALKPALEPVTVARKPLIGTVAANVLQHGTGAINVDGCRVGTRTENESGWSKTGSKASENRSMSGANYDRDAKDEAGTGRWPANLIHDGSDDVVGEFPANTGKSSGTQRTTSASWLGSRTKDEDKSIGYGDSGSAARFFYCAKASRRDRTESGKVENKHPTVKPTDLMRYLCRLVTQPRGIVLDPFMGSGSTAKAAIAEGFVFIGIEREREYFDIAVERVKQAQPKQVQEAMF